MQKQPRQAGGNTHFTAEPKAVMTKAKYRDAYADQPTVITQNIMWDRRVVRGNTYAAMVIPAGSHPDAITLEKEQEKIRQMQAKKQVAPQRDVSTPDPVEGRQHMDIQTEKFLEELTDKPPEYEQNVQTDFYIDRPPTPLFMPSKIGTDIATQIEDGELFDFDMEVEPILQVLVGKTLEQARMEVLEETELEDMRIQQREFKRLRDAELLETQRLEAIERRRADETDRRKRQQLTALENKKIAHMK